MGNLFETYTFDKGINLKKNNTLFLSEGELASCSGLVYDYDGVLTCRPEKTQGSEIDVSTDTGVYGGVINSTINGIHRDQSSIWASSKKSCPGGQSFFNTIYHRGTSDTSFTKVGTLLGNTRPKFIDYENFTFIIDGSTERALIGANIYNRNVDMPDHYPSATGTNAGDPSGAYYLYVTFEVHFSNDKVVESAPSLGGGITVSSKKIDWKDIPCSNYSGTGITIFRNLYRTVDGIAYLVDTIRDNTTTTYTGDNIADSVLQTNPELSTGSYEVPDICVTDMEIYLQRVFTVKTKSMNWSEPYLPFNELLNENAVVTKDGENLYSVVSWGDQLYMASKRQWYRLQGNDPTTWSKKETWTDNGIINSKTLKKTRFGLIGLWFDGIYLFDGSKTRNLTEKILGTVFFTSIPDTSLCYSDFDGKKYFFYYPVDVLGTMACIVLDFTYFSDNGFRIYSDDFVATAREYHKDSGITYFAKSGYEYSESGTETISTYLQTGDKGFQSLAKRKNLEYIHYEINTGGVDTVISFYVDGVLSSYTLTLNTSSQVRKRSGKLPIDLEGYKFNLKIACANSSNLKIYSPWILEATAVGD